MKTLLASAALAAAGLAATAAADDFNRGDAESMRSLTIAVFGDRPYSQYLLDNAHLLVNSVNADPSVSLVVQVGDIHSGSMPCTSAGKLPTLATANPGWNQAVLYQFQQ